MSVVAKQLDGLIDTTWYRRTDVDHGPGAIVLDGDPHPKKRGTQHPPNYGPCIEAKRLHGSRCHLVRVGLSPGHIVMGP